MFANRFCVLIVDDEIRMTKGLSDFFKSKNYMLYIANDGEEALNVYYNHTCSSNYI